MPPASLQAAAPLLDSSEARISVFAAAVLEAPGRQDRRRRRSGDPRRPSPRARADGPAALARWSAAGPRGPGRAAAGDRGGRGRAPDRRQGGRDRCRRRPGDPRRPSPRSRAGGPAGVTRAPRCGRPGARGPGRRRRSGPRGPTAVLAGAADQAIAGRARFDRPLTARQCARSGRPRRSGSAIAAAALARPLPAARAASKSAGAADQAIEATAAALRIPRSRPRRWPAAAGGSGRFEVPPAPRPWRLQGAGIVAVADQVITGRRRLDRALTARQRWPGGPLPAVAGVDRRLDPPPVPLARCGRRRRLGPVRSSATAAVLAGRTSPRRRWPGAAVAGDSGRFEVRRRRGPGALGASRAAAAAEDRGADRRRQRTASITGSGPARTARTWTPAADRLASAAGPSARARGDGRRGSPGRRRRRSWRPGASRTAAAAEDRGADRRRQRTASITGSGPARTARTWTPAADRLAALPGRQRALEATAAGDHLVSAGGGLPDREDLDAGQDRGPRSRIRSAAAGASITGPARPGP